MSVTVELNTGNIYKKEGSLITLGKNIVNILFTYLRHTAS